MWWTEGNGNERTQGSRKMVEEDSQRDVQGLSWRFVFVMSTNPMTNTKPTIS